MDDQLIELYHRHVGTAFDRQQRLAALLEKQDGRIQWEYDSTTGTFTYGKLTFEAPIVGTHTTTDSWLWAWSNKNLRLTITNRALGDTVRSLVHRHSVHQLGAPAFALEPLLGPELTQSAAHILGSILVPELGYDAFYTMPHDNGRELVLIRDRRLQATEKRPLVRIAMTFPVCIQEMPVLDHKAALTAYADDYGLKVVQTPTGLAISGDGKDTLTATFDEHNLLLSLEGVAIPAAKPLGLLAKKPAGKPAKKSPAAKAKAPAKKPAAKIVKPAAKAPAKKPAAKKPTPAKKPAGKKPTPAKKPAGKKR